MKRSRKAKGTKSNQLMQAFAKLAFYLVVAFFTKVQFDEMGKSPIDPMNREQPVQQGILPKQETNNKRTAQAAITKLNNYPD